MAKVKKETKAAENKSERIEQLKQQLEKDFGKGTLMGAKDKPMIHDVISTGSLGLDKSLGIGGLPKGRIIEILGPESSGKTTMCLQLIAEAHKDPNSHCAIVDAEHAIDTNYAQSIGVDLDRFDICQPSWGEQALEVTERLVKSGDFDVVIVDSVAALVPKAETEREMGESSMGKHAILMSQAMRKLTPIVAKSNTILVFINQLREKIGVMFGSPETTTGGNALKFYASVRLDIRRSTTVANSIMNGDIKLGNQTTVKVIKNKTAPPFRQCSFDILYGEGIDKYGELIDMAIENGILDKSGSFISYEGNNIGQGKSNAVEYLKLDGDMYNEIKDKLMETYMPRECKPVEENE